MDRFVESNEVSPPPSSPACGSPSLSARPGPGDPSADTLGEALRYLRDGARL